MTDKTRELTLLLICFHCSAALNKSPREVNAARKRGLNLYCGHDCANAAKRKFTRVLLTRERLKALLTYNRRTGVFRWKVKPHHEIEVGDVAGALRPDGYVSIMVDGRRYMAHRLAWLYVHGVFPPSQIDHINLIKHDNGIRNLRLAESFQNRQNVILATSNSCGRRGVSFSPRLGKWTAQIKVKGETIWLGTFDSPDKAGDAYIAAKTDLHSFATPRVLAAAAEAK